MKKFILKLLVTILGITLLGFAVGISIRIGLGVDPINAFYAGLAPRINWTIGQITTLFNIILLICIFIIDKKKIGLATLILTLFIQYPTDFGYAIFPVSEHYLINLFYLLIALIGVAIGCCLIIAGELGMGIYDAFTFGIADRFQIPYIASRYGTDFFFFVLALLVGGQLGSGTVLSLIVMGPFINFFRQLITKYIHFDA